MTSDLQQLKEFIGDRLNQLDRKIDDKFNEVEKRIIRLESDVQGIDKRLSNIEISVAKIPEITEKFGELKNWRQTAFLIIAAAVSAFLGWIARGGRV